MKFSEGLQSGGQKIGPNFFSTRNNSNFMYVHEGVGPGNLQKAFICKPHDSFPTYQVKLLQENGDFFLVTFVNCLSMPSIDYCGNLAI